ncbi:hypothetical protein TWF730_001362 [Orbilia blumenaviensis]|uniref:Uncharacterized protein n=1 Tax=Orbilia blumenaviensis TaxID=1796055 RepID=A0AAV9UL70_9PEZI
MGPEHSNHSRHLETLAEVSEDKMFVMNGIRESVFKDFIQRQFNFEEVSLTMEDILFDELQGEVFPSFGERFLFALTPTLKRLELTIDCISNFRRGAEIPPWVAVFQNVTYLSVRFGAMHSKEFAEITIWFPNVEELRAWALFSIDVQVEGDVAYRDIIQMTKLKRAFLLRQISPTEKRMTRKELQMSVEYWIGVGRDFRLPRLSLLETVEFSTNEDDMSIGCRIIRDPEEPDVSAVRYKPITSPVGEDGGMGFNDLEFEWETMARPFWQRSKEDPELRRPAGTYLSMNEAQGDKLSGPRETWPVYEYAGPGGYG